MDDQNGVEHGACGHPTVDETEFFHLLLIHKTFINQKFYFNLNFLYIFLPSSEKHIHWSGSLNPFLCVRVSQVSGVSALGHHVLCLKT